MKNENLKRIDWTEISKLGLLRRINKEIMHPLGYAVCRLPDGTSPGAVISDDGVWEYDETT